MLDGELADVANGMATTVFLADEQRLKLQGHDVLVRVIVCGVQARADLLPFTRDVVRRLDQRFPRSPGSEPVLTILLGETPRDAEGRDLEILGDFLQCDEEAPARWDDPAVKRQLVKEAVVRASVTAARQRG